VTHRDANKSIPAERLKELPTAPDNFKTAVEISTEFWLENIDRLTERFNKWAASQ
jgi:putative spermidine/putrescine transport system substrate-binding protein